MKKLINKLKMELEANPEFGFVIGSIVGGSVTIIALLILKYLIK